MIFSSLTFLCLFLPVTVGLYYLLPEKLKNGFLFAASLVFYAWGEPKYILLMLFSAAFDYMNGLLLDRARQKGKRAAMKAVLASSVAVNLGLLAFFKYAGFFVDNLNALGWFYLPFSAPPLPVGISFYTFQTLSYTVDVYRGRVRPQRNFVDFGMYVAMFPQLIAGPIVRYADIEAQLKNRAVSANAFASGVFRFTVGLAKKVLIANAAGQLWEEISARQGHTSALTAWLGALAFALQIYYDFSGYSDMAIGLGGMFGFTLPENFLHPYESASVAEFWRRWHVTLGVWFREYLYIPLGGNRCGAGRQIFNLFVVWFLTGLWHGAGWNFILWGLYFFVLLVLERFVFKKLLPKLPAAARHVLTLLLVLVSWVIFACGDMPTLGAYLKSMFAGPPADGAALYYLRSYALPLFLGAALSVRLVPNALKALEARLETHKTAVFVCKAVGALALAAVSVVSIVAGAYNPFLYFRF